MRTERSFRFFLDSLSLKSIQTFDPMDITAFLSLFSYDRMKSET